MAQKANAASISVSAKAAAAQVELNQLVALLNAGHHAEVERQAYSLLERHPDSGFAWKVLSLSLFMQGKDALFALQNAAKFLPTASLFFFKLASTPTICSEKSGKSNCQPGSRA